MPLPDSNAVNASIHAPSAAGSRRGRRDGFALVITLLILSLLVVVAVSYLSSMVGERQTADAYSAKARAEQVTQAGVDSAMAILAESFRDFPDSATVWDTQQSANVQASSSGVVSTLFNQGTSLYLRAVADQSTGAAKPQPVDPTVPANDPKGNNPNDPACKNFVLPLISGVPNGRAQPVSAKANLFPQKMDLGVTDPVSQTYTDLNVRRFKGDLQGVIGSPPRWAPPAPYPVLDPTDPTMPPSYPPAGPRPARAYWVDLKDSTGRKTGRYAFWIEDESFRTNINAVGTDPNALRADNSQDGKSAVDTSTPPQPRSLQPSDVNLTGTLADFDGGGSSADAGKMLTTRAQFPGSFFPDPLSFSHTFDSASKPLPTPTTQLVDATRYLTTTQSGALNLTRHGTQRLNLNAPTTIAATKPVTMTEIRKLVETIRFHLPNFGQRFYRTANPFPPPPTVLSPTQTGTILNKSGDVTTNYAEIYLYKMAANLRDYIDADDQPTMILAPKSGATLPTLWMPNTPIKHPFGGDGEGGNGSNYMWAQGKEGAPFLQEAMVRYRPAIPDNGDHYTLSVDYYVEFWNMSDHDVTAFQLGNHPFLRISYQQPWVGAHIASTGSGAAAVPVSGAQPSGSSPLSADSGISPSNDITRDFNMDLVNGVFRGDNPTTAVPTSTGVVFKAGTATVITTDPDFVAYGSHNAPVINAKYAYGGQKLGANGLISTNVYYCSQTQDANGNPAQRTFSGLTNVPLQAGYLRGIKPVHRAFENATNYLDFEIEAVLGNDLGYIDCATGAFCIAAGKSDSGSNGYNFTWTHAGTEAHNDYLEGGTLGGNTNTPSELGDPRSNNEQLVITLYNGVSFPAQPDQYRYGSPGQSLAPPFSLGSPNSQYVKPATGTYPWGDYYDWSSTTYPPPNPTYATSPGVIANSPLTSIGQLGDLFDPVRVIGSVGAATIENSRGGGRTLKIGQRDDRVWYDPSNNSNGNNTPDNTASSNGWASWRLADVFCIADSLELPARMNINGVARDNGSALRAALTGFIFQPQTQADGNGIIKDALIHGASTTAGISLKTLPTDSTGVSKLVSQIKTRLDPANKANGNIPYGPFFERGELGELETGGIALFGKNVNSSFIVSNDLAGKDLNHTFDRGREELFRRLAELICTRGDTFTVYAVGQSLVQTDINQPAKITGTHRMRVTFRLVPKQYDTTRTKLDDFHPGYSLNPDGSIGPASDFDPTTQAGLNKRFAKPDLYDVQILEVNPL